MKPFKAFPSHQPTHNGSHAKGWVRREWEEGAWTEGGLGMGPGRPIDSHHRGHQALIVGSLYQGTSESFEVIYILHIIYIIYYILYLLYYIAYSIHTYIYILGLFQMGWGLARPHTHISICIYIDREGEGYTSWYILNGVWPTSNFILYIQHS